MKNWYYRTYPRYSGRDLVQVIVESLLDGKSVNIVCR